jgi:hypothetical protein
MIFKPLLTVVLAALAQFVNAQDDGGDIVYDAEHNATSIVGTWSSQSGAVTTGPVGSTSFHVTMTFAEPLLGIRRPCKTHLLLSQEYRCLILLVRLTSAYWQITRIKWDLQHR